MSAKLRRYWKGSRLQGKSYTRRPPRTVATIRKEKAKAERQLSTRDRLYWPIMRDFDYETAERKRLDAYKKKGGMPIEEIRRRLGNAYAEHDPFALVVVDDREALIRVQLVDREWIENVTLDEVRNVAIYG